MLASRVARPERVGLPSGPASRRAQSVGRSNPGDSVGTTSRSITSHRSAESSSDRGRTRVPRPSDVSARAPSLPPSPSSKRSTSTTPNPRRILDSPPPVPSSDLLQRMQTRSRNIPSQYVPPSTPSVPSSGLVERMKSRSGEPPTKHWAKDRSTRSLEMEPNGDQLTTESGYSLWERLRVAAGSLTVNVTRTWETKISTSYGEMTPPGQESRLLSAMKAYHIDKARDLSDLPEWLFDEQPRWAVTRSGPTESLSSTAKSPAPSSHSRALREIYNTVAEEQKQMDSQPRPSSKAPATRSKAEERLQNMKAARRRYNTIAGDEPLPAPVGNQKSVVGNDGLKVVVGLPRRPGIGRPTQ